jgi:hypothetical protein
VIDEVLLAAPQKAFVGLRDGSLKIVGSVVRWATAEKNGQIFAHLQPTAASEMAQQTALRLDDLKQGQEVMQAMLGNLSGGMQMLQVMSGLNLALSVVDIGISVAGFALMNAKLNVVQGAIHEVSGGIRSIQQEAIERDFIKLRALAERYENTWSVSDYSRAAPILMKIASNANETQILLEYHAQNMLQLGLEMLPVADRMLDGMALTIGLRVSAAMAANESELARKIADDGFRKIEAITGGIGQIDLAQARLPKGIDTASKDWEAEFAKAKEETTPIIAKLRTREANAATRSSPLPTLKAKGITSREWLEHARLEREEPMLVLAH